MNSYVSFKYVGQDAAKRPLSGTWGLVVTTKFGEPSDLDEVKELRDVVIEAAVGDLGHDIYGVTLPWWRLLGPCIQDI